MFHNSLPFQSHYGLILSHSSLSLLPSPPSCFNPTMVWFYRDKFSGFHNLITWFQSHYGLILSDMGSCRDLHPSSRFNPTMVWFYHHVLSLTTLPKKRVSIPLWSDFISNILYNDVIGKQSFNPTMVWFYPTNNFFNFSAEQFQSHYGLILSFDPVILVHLDNKFQSHYGLILSCTEY